MKPTYLLRLFLIPALLLSSSRVYAIVGFEDHAFPEVVTSARALALGNTYMSKVDDSWAAFYNPAGLGTVRGLQFHLLNASFEINDGLNNAARDGSVSAGESLTNLSSSQSAAGLRELLADVPGTTTHSRVQSFPNITFRGFSLGYMYSLQNKARLQDEDDADLEIAQRTDQGPVASLSVSLFGGVIKFGASAVQLTRKQLQKDFAPTDDLEVEDTDYTYGTMTLLTAGARITLPIWGLPTLSYVARNSAGTKFSGESDDFGGLPPDIPATFDAGVSLTPMLGKNFRVHIEAGMKDIGDAYGMPSSRRVGAGIEFDYMRSFFVRFGYGDGWGSGGLGVRSRSFVFDLTTYAIEQTVLDEEGEIDTSVKRKQDRRFMLSFARGF
ncbi:hypothetical protein N9N67_06220 [Bacteriovoracaceae bacterium]|nr:hypothetical protein [Bacteriovoracaceae bacterium]